MHRIHKLSNIKSIQSNDIENYLRFLNNWYFKMQTDEQYFGSVIN